MKQKRLSLLALMLCIALILPTVFMAGEVTPEFFLQMTDDAQADYLASTGLSYEEAAGYGTDGGNMLLEDGYVQCADCCGWYMNGNEFRNHFCTGDPANPSSSWTSTDDYYNALVQGKLNGDTVMAIGTLYVKTANGKNLNLRTRPNTDGEIQTTIPDGAAVTLFWYENNAWAFVAYRSYFGFCMTRHLTETQPTPNQPAPAPAASEDPNKMYQGFRHVNYLVAVKPTNPTGFVNMRWAPSKSADVQCIYYADTVLRVIATNGTWSQVYNDLTHQSGFMMNAYLNKYMN